MRGHISSALPKWELQEIAVTSLPEVHSFLLNFRSCTSCCILQTHYFGNEILLQKWVWEAITQKVAHSCPVVQILSAKMLGGFFIQVKIIQLPRAIFWKNPVPQETACTFYQNNKFPSYWKRGNYFRDLLLKSLFRRSRSSCFSNGSFNLEDAVSTVYPRK